VYIPLGGNRKGNVRTYVNVAIVFLLTGIWHGANFTFILWGIFYALLQIIERLFLKKLLEKNPIKIINWIYAMFMVIIGWVLFRSDDIYQAQGYIHQLFIGKSTTYSILSYLSMEVIVLFIFGIVFSGLAQQLLKKQIDKLKTLSCFQNADFIFQILIIIFSIFRLVSGTYNPFIYFQF
jgi:alginate O-acetyltransferase complex protein AlgI